MNRIKKYIQKKWFPDTIKKNKNGNLSDMSGKELINMFEFIKDCEDNYGNNSEKMPYLKINCENHIITIERK